MHAARIEVEENERRAISKGSAPYSTTFRAVTLSNAVNAAIEALAAKPVEPSAPAMPVCLRCDDTHVMTIGSEGDEQEVGCTGCPTPCQKCRVGGTGPYCETTPCSCLCHAPSAAKCKTCGGSRWGRCLGEDDDGVMLYAGCPDCAGTKP